MSTNFFRVKKEIKKNLSCQEEISIFDQSKSMNWKKSKWSQKCMNYVQANLDLRNHNFSGVNQEWFDLRNTYELWKPVGRVNLQVEIFLKLRFHIWNFVNKYLKSKLGVKFMKKIP